MKTKIVTFIFLAVAEILAYASPNQFTNFVIGLSPSYPPSDRTAVARSIKILALNCPKGSRIMCHDAFNLSTITVLAVPNLPYDSPANRARLLARSFAELDRWFKESANESAGSSNPCQLRVPEFLDFVAIDGMNGPRSILLLGSPLAQYPSEPSFSMTGDGPPRIPSDAHLRASLQVSPYGTADRKDHLRGCQIAWCFGGENIWSNALQKTLVTRFWFLLVKEQGGNLVRFTPDLHAAFAALATPALPPMANYALDLDDTKLEMRLALPRHIPVWMPASFPQTNSVQTTAAVEHPALSTAAPPTPPAPRLGAPSSVQAPHHAVTAAQGLPVAPLSADNLGIGIMWQARCDLDLYVRPEPEGPQLWFMNTVIPGGFYHHDYRDGNFRNEPGKFDYEYAELKPPVDIRHVQAWINYYEGTATAPSGAVVVWYQGQQFTGTFSMAASRGNHGADSGSRNSSSYWTRIDLLKIVNLNP